MNHTLSIHYFQARERWGSFSLSSHSNNISNGVVQSRAGPEIGRGRVGQGWVVCLEAGLGVGGRVWGQEQEWCGVEESPLLCSTLPYVSFLSFKPDDSNFILPSHFLL